MPDRLFAIKIIGTAMFLSWCASAVAAPGSNEFFENNPGASNYDYGDQTALPPGFGSAEFTLELWLRLDDSLPVGSTAGGFNQRHNWSSENATRYQTS